MEKLGFKRFHICPGWNGSILFLSASPNITTSFESLFFPFLILTRPLFFQTCSFIEKKKHLKGVCSLWTLMSHETMRGCWFSSTSKRICVELPFQQQVGLRIKSLEQHERPAVPLALIDCYSNQKMYGTYDRVVLRYSRVNEEPFPFLSCA